MNLDQIKARFQSGNSVPVDKAMLPKAEFDYLIDLIEALEKRIGNQSITIDGQADRIEQLERENAELQAKLEAADKRCTQSMTDLVNNIVADRRW
jgi:uncharacterized coiled-coil protein SlyX